GPGGKVDERAHRVGLLAVEDPLVFDGAVAAPIADGGERVMRDGAGDGPVVKDDRLKRRDPIPPTCGNGAVGTADRLADREEVSVAAEPDVDALGCVPELDERRIEIEVNANRDAGGQVFVREHAGDVYQHVSPAADGSEFVVRKADGLPAASQQKRGGLLKAE